jgi:hypothetical protein
MAAAHWKPLGEHTGAPKVAPKSSGWFGFGKKVDETVKPDQEFVICVPPFPKRAELTQKLVSNKNIILIDLDSFIDTVNEKKLLDQIADAEKTENNALHHILYSMAASKALDFVRREVSKDSKMKAVLITSDYEWSSRNFEPHCIYAALPSRDLHKQIVEATPKDEVDRVEKQRVDFISRLPYDAVRTFNTYDELEQMIRTLFDIQHKH